MAKIHTISLKEIMEEFNLELLHRSTDFDRVQVLSEDINRPGLQLGGFFDFFEPMRLQVMGFVESSYLRNMTQEERFVAFDRFLAYKPPALMISRGQEPLEECLAMVKKHDISLLRTGQTTSEIMTTMIASLRDHLAPRTTLHGVLVDVYGEGLLILGESGVGKSETAVELLKRGHRLIADDAVEIKKLADNMLQGTAPPLIRHYIELRGIGVTNVAQLFGMAAIKDRTIVDTVIKLEPWNDEQVFSHDRLGLEEEYMEILGVQVPCQTIPVRPGRNLAVILEVAAMNNRQKKMGYNAAQEFADQISQQFE